MEILIVGGILVALMVYVSTRIKRTAAEAFEREVIETADFKLTKPEGFLNPASDAVDVYEARSKELGETSATRNVPQARFVFDIKTGANFKKLCAEAKRTAGKIVSEKMRTDEAARQKIYLLESERAEGDAIVCEFRKLIHTEKRHGDVHDLKISVLKNFRAQYDEKIKEILDGLSIK